MTIPIRDEVTYAIFKKIEESGQKMHEVGFSESDFGGQQPTEAELLGHLDYLNQQHYINAEFTGNAYGDRENVPFPEVIKFKAAELTDKGRSKLQQLNENPPESLKKGKAVPIASKDMPFLEKVMLKGNISDPYDARDITEVVYRIMRDLMSTEAADDVAEELHKEVLETDDKSLQMEITDLWKDTNPIVRFLSRVRPPWQGPGIFKIDSDRFLFRVANEGALGPTTSAEQVVSAVFSATKDELSEETKQEIASWLPDRVRQIWEEA